MSIFDVWNYEALQNTYYDPDLVESKIIETVNDLIIYYLSMPKNAMEARVASITILKNIETNLTRLLKLIKYPNSELSEILDKTILAASKELQHLEHAKTQDELNKYLEKIIKEINKDSRIVAKTILNSNKLKEYFDFLCQCILGYYLVRSNNEKATLLAIEILKDLKVKFNICRDNDSISTPLNLALASRNLKYVQALVNAGACYGGEEKENFEKILEEAYTCGFQTYIEFKTLLIKAGFSQPTSAECYIFRRFILKNEGEDKTIETINHVLSILNQATTGQNKIDEDIFSCYLNLIDSLRNIDLKLNNPFTNNANTSNLINYLAVHASPQLMAFLLTGGGFNAYRRDTNAITPLHYAVYSGNVVMTRLFILAGAIVDAPDNEGKTPLDWAYAVSKEGKDNPCIQILLANGACVDSQSSDNKVSSVNSSNINNNSTQAQSCEKVIAPSVKRDEYKIPSLRFISAQAFLSSSEPSRRFSPKGRFDYSALDSNKFMKVAPIILECACEEAIPKFRC